MNPVYLGDGAYIRLDAETDELVIYTSNGLDIENEVFLDRRIAARLHDVIAIMLSEVSP